MGGGKVPWQEAGITRQNPSSRTQVYRTQEKLEIPSNLKPIYIEEKSIYI